MRDWVQGSIDAVDKRLARSRWLDQCRLHYWGDIDTHGFGILDRLRGHFRHVESFLMDRATLDAHESAWGIEDTPLSTELRRLDEAERTLYDDLRSQRIWCGLQLRLEQEHIDFDRVKKALDTLSAH